MDKRRLLFAIGFLIVTIILGILLWMVFFAPKPTPRPVGPDGQPLPTDGFPEAGQGGTRGSVTDQPGSLPTPGQTPGTTPPTTQQPGSSEPSFVLPASVQLIDVPVLAATKDTLGAAKFYNKQDGKFYRLLPDGSLELLSEQTFFNVANVVWSPEKNETIIEYPDGSNIYYNFDSKEQVTLPKHWENFSFSPQSDKIAAKSLGFSPENRWLITSDPTGNNISLIEPLGENADQVIIDWSPNKQIVGMALTGEPLGAYRQELLFIGQNKENFKSTIVEGRGLTTAWSPTGEKLLYSAFSNQTNFNPTLWVVNASGDQIGTGRKLLEVNTWANKCGFGTDDRYVYCGVPQNLPAGAGFQPGLGNTTQDSIMKIDTQTGLKTEIPVETPPTVQSMFLSDDGKTLFYTDVNVPGIFSIPL